MTFKRVIECLLLKARCQVSNGRRADLGSRETFVCERESVAVDQKVMLQMNKLSPGAHRCKKSMHVS